MLYLKADDGRVIWEWVGVGWGEDALGWSWGEVGMGVFVCRVGVE